MFHLNAGDDDV